MRVNELGVIVCVASFALVCASLSIANAAQEGKTDQDKAPSYTVSTDGPGLYRTYCAVCHGVRGQGDGPAAPAMKQKVSDLTVLSRRNGGKFPEEQVYASISGDRASKIRAHGTSDMPTWGYIFRRDSKSPGDREAVTRLKTLTAYVKSIQVK
ncbi:MAG: cytochrome c [Bryobacterales bacterium]|nr:cytochrome c [Bryobacterales bacterium]